MVKYKKVAIKMRCKNKKLDHMLFAFIAQIKAVADEVRREGKRFDDMHDLPKVAVGCRYGKAKFCGRSGSAHKRYKRSIPRAPFNSHLYNALHAISPTSKIPGTFVENGERRYLGTCAEDDAANKVLNIYDPYVPTLNKLKFTKSLRPRTGSIIRYCKTCQTIFT